MRLEMWKGFQSTLTHLSFGVSAFRILLVEANVVIDMSVEIRHGGGFVGRLKGINAVIVDIDEKEKKRKTEEREKEKRERHNKRHLRFHSSVISKINKRKNRRSNSVFESKGTITDKREKARERERARER